MNHRTVLIPTLFLIVGGLLATPDAQRAGSFMGSSEDVAIKYSTTQLNNVVEEANRKIQAGAVPLMFEGRGGFLKSALNALQIPVDSQLLVFSTDSLQGRLINERSPRAIYFNDRVTLGWVRDGDFIEVAAHDDTAGVAFYTLEQRAGATYRAPQFMRGARCTGCHASGDTHGVPGLIMFSTTQPGPSLGSGVPRRVDHAEPLSRRFGGWFVTGTAGSTPHMGNNVAALSARPERTLASAAGLFDPDGYPSVSSDIVAHLLFAHQAGMTNLLTRASYEVRAADPLLHAPFTSSPEEDARVASMMIGVARETVDYLLFIDETKLSGAIRGNSGFAERFSARGPRDRKGRSLHELELTRRLMKYPCSYLIYSPAFDALPRGAKEPIYRRMWEVLSGQERSEKYTSALTLRDRRAIVEILRDTKKDLPPYFQGVIR
jgi:hypothetical protein